MQAQANLMGIDIGQLTTLKRLADSAARYQVRESNGEPVNASPRMELVEDYAKDLGFTVKWPGFYPTFEKNGQTFYTPE